MVGSGGGEAGCSLVDGGSGGVGECSLGIGVTVVSGVGGCRRLGDGRGSRYLMGRCGGFASRCRGAVVGGGVGGGVGAVVVLEDVFVATFVEGILVCT